VREGVGEGEREGEGEKDQSKRISISIAGKFANSIETVTEVNESVVYIELSAETGAEAGAMEAAGRD